MRIFNLVFTFIVLLFVTACSNQEIVDNEEILPIPTRTLKLKAMMPGGDTKSSGPTTRLSLTETDEGTIDVKWKEGDKINLCFVSQDGDVVVVRTVSNVSIINISENGKQADFEIAIPEGITGTFNLYGVYGASFSPGNSSTVVLPSNAGSASGTGTALSDLEDITVMRFAAENLTDASTPQVSFSHLGSILAIYVKNAFSYGFDLNQITLSSEGYGYNWLKNYTINSTYDIATNSFINANDGTGLAFRPPGTTYVAAGDSVKLYRWFIPGNTIGTGNSATKFDFKTYVNPTNYSYQISTKKLEPGKFYRLRMEWRGTNFSHIKPAAPNLPIDENLVGYWPFDGDANDIAGTNNGTLIGNVVLTADRDGNENSAYYFDGNGDYIRCNTTGVTGTTARTFSFWARADALSTSEQTIFSYGGTIVANGSRFEVSLINGEMICDISGSNRGMKSTSISNANWNFHTVVFSGGANQTLSSGVKYYVNGVLLTEAGSKTRDDAINTATNNPIYFGSLYGTGRYFKGAIDEMRMYNRAMSDSEVMALYNAY